MALALGMILLLSLPEGAVAIVPILVVPSGLPQ
jgi:hypothetical protein